MTDPRATRSRMQQGLDDVAAERGFGDGLIREQLPNLFQVGSAWADLSAHPLVRGSAKTLGVTGLGLDVVIRTNDEDGFTSRDALAMTVGTATGALATVVLVSVSTSAGAIVVVPTLAAMGAAYLVDKGILFGGMTELEGYFSQEVNAATYTRWAQSQGLPLSNDYPIDLINGGPQCFPSNTPILLASGETRAICAVRAGDLILAFDGAAELGRGGLVPKRVTRLYRNETTEWVRLSWDEDGEARELVVTPGHHFLTAHGTFEQIGDMAADGRATVVLADGRLTEVVAERIVYSAETAGLFECAQVSGLAVHERLS